MFLYSCAYYYIVYQCNYINVCYVIAPTLPKLVKYLKGITEGWEEFGIFLFPDDLTYKVEVKYQFT